MSEEEKASGISVEDFKEKESLIGELVEREHSIQAKAEPASKEQPDCRRYQGGASPKRLKSSLAEPLVDFLREKRRLTTGVSCETTGTGKSTANDESYDPSAATNEYFIFFLNVVKKLLNK